MNPKPLTQGHLIHRLKRPDVYSVRFAQEPNLVPASVVIGSVLFVCSILVYLLT
jgi:hypothetical protein